VSSATIPIIPLGQDFLISFQGDVQDDQLSSLKERLFDKLSSENIRSVILDVSGLSTMDSFMARLLNELAKGAKLNGAETYLVGIQPQVAMTLVQMGLSIPDVKAEQSVERVLDSLNTTTEANE
jgi:rsbT antagonist protein RsbS